MSFSRAIFPPKVLLKTTETIGGRGRGGRAHTIPCHMMTSYDTAAICQSVLVENDVRMGVPSWVHKELSKSYREVTAQKLKSMALPYKTKVRKKVVKKRSQIIF